MNELAALKNTYEQLQQLSSRLPLTPHGAPSWLGDTLSIRFDRMIVMFDGQDEMAVNDARALWKKASGQGCTVSYWRQSPEGRWEKKA